MSASALGEGILVASETGGVLAIPVGSGALLARAGLSSAVGCELGCGIGFGAYGGGALVQPLLDVLAVRVDVSAHRMGGQPFYTIGLGLAFVLVED